MTNGQTNLFYTGKGPCTAATLLGSGGEGQVYAVTEYPHLVAKIYHTHKATAELHTKLQWMVAHPPTDPCAALKHISIAWPGDILYSDPRCQQFAGYLMPKISGAKKLAAAYHPPTRKQQMPGFTWQYLLCVARNLASSLQAVHNRGYVIGDLNESNVLLFPSALITIIDTDSFQVVTPTQTFRSCVGKPEYTAPESQLRNFSTFDRTIHDDGFALAVLIFLLLAEGRHPFDGVATTVPDCMDIGERIRANWFKMAHAKVGAGVSPPAKCPPFATLPPGIRDLFLRCFVDGATRPSQRPQASNWMRALDVAMQNLSVCTRNPMHAYSTHHRECSWCRRMILHHMADPFPLPGNYRPSPTTAVGRTALKSQPPLPKKTRTMTTATPIPQRKAVIPVPVSQQPAKAIPAKQSITNALSGLGGAKQHVTPIPQSSGIPVKLAQSCRVINNQCSPAVALPSAKPIAPAEKIPAAPPITPSLFGVALPSAQGLKSRG